MLADINNARAARCQRLLLPVAILLKDLKSVVVEERLQFLRVCKATGDARFFYMIAFAISPATISCPVHQLSEWIINLCVGQVDAITFHTDIASFVFLVRDRAEIMA